MSAISGVTRVPSDSVHALPVFVKVKFNVAPAAIAAITLAAFWRRRSWKRRRRASDCAVGTTCRVWRRLVCIRLLSSLPATLDFEPLGVAGLHWCRLSGRDPAPTARWGGVG